MAAEMMRRGFSYRLEPNPEQESVLFHWVGVVRLVYNLALEQRRDYWRQHHRKTGRGISSASQGPEITALRREFDWIREVPCNCLHQAMRDLDRAFAGFYSGRAKYPNFRKKGANDKVRMQRSDLGIKRLNAVWSAVRLPKLGWVKFRDTRPIQGVFKSATVSHDAAGWRISFACEIEHEATTPLPLSVGIDRGVATTLALSTGEMLTMPARLERIEIQKRKAQRVAARRKRGSKRRQRAQRRVARLQAQQTRIRRDFHHKAALSIARRFGVAVLEDLNTRSMTASAKGTAAEPGRNVRQKAGLNRVILNGGWRLFQTILTYKMEERGGQVVTVDPKHTSQTCSACGVVDARSRKNQAAFECISCGHRDHADTNAAKEILRRGSTPCLRVEGSRQRPGEARTEAVRKHGLNLALA